ncbi:6-phosphogluconate dehydrogenase [Escherichia coli]|uniref:6-phosphogluconate dehydrogenase n=1 Tax=Escherichia coli TaxID=562 RepID=A0A2X1M8Q3_ECOLX|nr:6-phosphogluconate dehydrogenase [Escherichia coli]
MLLLIPSSHTSIKVTSSLMAVTPSSRNTIRRNRELSAEGFNFIGTGVSGGEEGALKGPSIMPGGQKEAYELVAPILTKIAAVAEDGEPCVTYIGADGAGHYVKMVHNGIEYGDMQLIAEAYSLLKGGLNLSNEETGTDLYRVE